MSRQRVVLLFITIVAIVLFVRSPAAAHSICPTTSPLLFLSKPATTSATLYTKSCTEPEPSPSSSPSPSPSSSPEATPTATPSATPVPHHDPDTPANHSTTETTAQRCEETNTVKPAANVHVFRGGDQAIVKWFPTEGNLVHIYYKQVESTVWQYSVRGAQNNGSFTISGLGSMDITFAVQQVNGCSGGPLSPAIIDGASQGWVLFRETI